MLTKIDSIKNITKETANAVSVVFDIPENLKSNFQFTAGQYVTLKTILNGEDVRRAYSICSAPKSGELKVAIKAVENGTFSVYATSELKVGDEIEMDSFPGADLTDRHAKRSARALYIWNLVKTNYTYLKTTFVK